MIYFFFRRNCDNKNLKIGTNFIAVFMNDFMTIWVGGTPLLKQDQLITMKR